MRYIHFNTNNFKTPQNFNYFTTKRNLMKINPLPSPPPLLTTAAASATPKAAFCLRAVI